MSTQPSARAARRVRPMTPGDLRADQTVLYDAILGGPRASGPQHFSLTAADGSLAGPFNALLLSPGIGAAVQELGAAIRYRSQLPGRVRELAILVVAAKWHSAFETAAHEAVGRAVGLTDAELADVAAGRHPQLADPFEDACVRATRAIADGDIDDELWADVAGVVSAEALFELTTLVGYYAGLALQMRVFRADS